MQKWEYCEMSPWADKPCPSVRFFKPDGVTEVQFRRDRSKNDKSDSDAAFRYIAELGQDGWELVNVIGGGFYFKRSLEGS